MTPAELFASARVARLATVDDTGAPHLVPIVFALVGDVIYSAVDDKPKRHRRLRRLVNVAHEPRVSVLADHYDDDWTRLWWVRADGTAAVLPWIGKPQEADAAQRPKSIAGEGRLGLVEVRDQRATLEREQGGDECLKARVLCGNDVFRLAKLDTERWKGRITGNAELRKVVIPFSSGGFCNGCQRLAAAYPLEGFTAEVKWTGLCKSYTELSSFEQ